MGLHARPPFAGIEKIMAKVRPRATSIHGAEPQHLKGWKQIASHLGIPTTTAHRWAEGGMPVRREGRFVVLDVPELSAWLGRESHMPKPAHIMTKKADLSAALSQSIAATRAEKKRPR